MTPVKRPSSPSSITMFALSDSRIRVSLRAPLHNGGLPIAKYAVQWDTKANFPSAWVEGFNYKKFADAQEGDETGVVHCHTFTIDIASSDVPCYSRVLAFNGHQWSNTLGATVLSTKAAVGKPGPVRDFKAFPTSNIGMMLTWSHPSVNDEDGCNYAGDGGSFVTHYLIKYDEEADFSTPAKSVLAPSASTMLRVGGREVLSGSESPFLKASGTYFACITPFNSIGAGKITTFHSPIGPLENTVPRAPEARNALAVSASSIQVEWDTPTFDGGSVSQEYLVEYDTDSSFQSTPRISPFRPSTKSRHFRWGRMSWT